MFRLVNESQVLPSRTEDSKKELPDTLRNLGSPCGVGVDDAIDEGADKETILQLLLRQLIRQRRGRRPARNYDMGINPIK